MESILFEKQEASLCAQHALNMLLQGPYFSAVDLAEIAHDLDERENLVLGTDSSSSRNMDDSGFFSVQVVAEALRVFNLELIPLTSPSAAEYRADPTCGRAYICNLNDHWFAIRRFGFQWFKLNSLLSSPKLISDTYLSLYLAQLANDGYSIFVVVGELPHCNADEILTQCPVDPALAAQDEPIREDQREDEDLARAIALSLTEDKRNEEASDDDLQAAMRESKRLDENDDISYQQALTESAREAMEQEEEEMERQLQCALHMSLQTHVPATESAGGKEQEIANFSASGSTKEKEEIGSADSAENSKADEPLHVAAEIRLKREKFLKRFGK